jgi:hypothetical protein
LEEKVLKEVSVRYRSVGRSSKIKGQPERWRAESLKYFAKEMD